MSDTKRFVGRVALVTGGGNGIGIIIPHGDRLKRPRAPGIMFTI